MQNDSFNLVHTSSVLLQRWKTIALFVIICTMLAAGTSFIVPKYYRSSATIVPGNAALADKGRLFNQNIRDLYSYFGSGDDLDRILGICQRETTYLQLTDEFSLVNYYHLSGNEPAVLRKKAAKRLQKDISITKTDEGQLRITTWMREPQLSASIVNRLIAIVQEASADIWKAGYRAQIADFDSSLASLQKEYVFILDSAVTSRAALTSLRVQQLQERIQYYSRVADEFKLASQSLPPVLYVTEAATPAAFAERPDKPAIVIAAAILSLLFACIVVLVNNREAKA